MDTQNYLSLGDGSEIMKQFPKSSEKLMQWTKDLYPEEQREEINEEMIRFLSEQILTLNYRFLYEFFDSQDIMVTIKFEGEGNWVYYSNKEQYSGTASTRTEAEKKIFLDSFKTLEGIL